MREIYVRKYLRPLASREARVLGVDCSFVGKRRWNGREEKAKQRKEKTKKKMSPGWIEHPTFASSVQRSPI